MSLLAILGLGLLLGMQHATEGDHLAAVATLAGRKGTLAQGVRHGVAWGLGHTLMLLIVAGGAGLLGWVILPEWADRFEQVVGAMLIALGLSLAWRLYQERHHVHGHHHGRHHRVPARSLVIGMVHGLAGSAALALLVGQTMPSPGWGLIYIVVFGLGSVLGMALLSGTLAWSLGRGATRLTLIYQWFNGAAALVSVAFGARLVFAGLH